ncbi:MAG: TlpA disulfide reductase family protein [Gammaproteobacteria bacterium]
MSVRAAVLLFLCLLVAPLAAARDLLQLDRLSDTVPPFDLAPAVVGDGTLDLAALAGRTVLLHFWATWCGPCRDELPALQGLADHLDAARFAVVLVAIDETATGDEVARYARELGVTLPVYLARESTVSDRYWQWGVPVSYVIDRRGGFVGRALGPRAWAEPAVADALRGLE